MKHTDCEAQEPKIVVAYSENQPKLSGRYSAFLRLKPRETHE